MGAGDVPIGPHCSVATRQCWYAARRLVRSGKDNLAHLALREELIVDGRLIQRHDLLHEAGEAVYIGCKQLQSGLGWGAEESAAPLASLEHGRRHTSNTDRTGQRPNWKRRFLLYSAGPLSVTS